MSLRSVRVTGAMASHSWSVRAPAGQYAHAPSWIVTGLPVATVAFRLASRWALARQTKRTRLLFTHAPKSFVAVLVVEHTSRHLKDNYVEVKAG
jgi:hypothetical protein